MQNFVVRFILTRVRSVYFEQSDSKCFTALLYFSTSSAFKRSSSLRITELPSTLKRQSDDTGAVLAVENGAADTSASETFLQG